MSRFIVYGLTAATAVMACADHNVDARFGTLNKRADGGQDWAYEASYNWGMINPSKFTPNSSSNNNHNTPLTET